MLPQSYKSKQKRLKSATLDRPEAKPISIPDEFDVIANNSLVTGSELLEQIKQFAPHLLALLAGPKAEPLWSPLECKTTDQFLYLIELGWSVSEIATIWSVDRAQLSRWIAADGQRSTQARLARKAQAEIWDRVAFAIGLFAPSDRIEMTRAKLLMDHCRWRSSMYNPEEYVKRLSVRSTAEDIDGHVLTTAELQTIAGGGVPSRGL